MRGGADLVHVEAARQHRRVGVLAARVGIDLSVQHQHLHVGAVLKHDFRNVLETNVAHAAITANGPNLRQLANLPRGHVRVGEVAEAETLARGVSTRGGLDTMLAELPVAETERAARRAVALLAAGDQLGARHAWEAARVGELFREHAEEELALLPARPARRAR